MRKMSKAEIPAFIHALLDMAVKRRLSATGPYVTGRHPVIKSAAMLAISGPAAIDHGKI